VLLHAFPANRTLWRGVADRLASYVPLVLVDLPGLGESPLPSSEQRREPATAAPDPDVATGPDLGVAVDGVAAVLDRLGHRRAVLAGVSMGGYVALGFGRRFPDRLAGLGLLDTKATADGDDARANRERMAVAVTGDTGLRALEPLRQSLIGLTSHASRPHVVQALARFLSAADPFAVAWSQRAMAARPDSLALLPSLHVPAVVVVGDEDGVTPLGEALAMVQALPDAVLTVLPGVGHLSPLEDPDGVAAALTALMVRVRPT
jgi:pimeloyl-ACP methyl ester carboxylesterase